MRIALVVATPWEARPIARRLHLRRGSPPFFYRGGDQTELFLGVCGMGPEQARSFVRQALNLLKPDVVINAGFSGALQSHLKPGDLVIDDRLSRSQRKGLQTALRKSGIPAYFGRIVQVDRVLSTPKEKIEWGGRTGALAVDMESEVISQWAKDRGLPHVIVRTIIDGVNDLLVTDRPASPSLGDSIQYVWSHRYDLTTLIKTATRFMIAKNHLCEMLQDYLRPVHELS